MKILITDNSHVHYDRTGEIIDKADDTWTVAIPNKDGSIRTTVKEGQFKVIKPLSEPADSGKVYRPDGAGCVERVHPTELAWEERYG